MLDSLQERASLHLFDHVDGVINHWAVRTEGDVYASCDCEGCGTNTTAPHRLAGWAINETSSAVRNQPEISRRAVDAVHQNPGRIEKAHLHQHLRVSLSGLAQDLEVALVKG